MKEVKNKKQDITYKDKLIKLLLIIVLVLAIIIVAIKFFNRNNLDINSKIVNDLHNYFNYDDLGNCEGLFNYTEKKVEYNDINSETKICLAYQKAEIKNVEKEILKKDKKKNTCTQDEMIFRINEETEECEITKIDKNIIDESYKKLYGNEIENNESFRIDNLNICYLKDDKYYCGLSETFTYTLGNESIIYRVIEKAIEEGSEIVIYDYFAKINNDTCYKNYTTTTINETCTTEYQNRKDKEINYDFMNNYGTKYKHVYKQASDKTYYWISSEPLN